MAKVTPKEGAEKKRSAADILEDVGIFEPKAGHVEEPADPKEFDPENPDSEKPWGKTFGSPGEKLKEAMTAVKEDPKPAIVPVVEAEKHITPPVGKEVVTAAGKIIETVGKVPEPEIVPVQMKGQITIERSYHIAKQEEPTKFSTRTLDTPIMRFLTQPAKVAVKYGATLNMGNFESVRVDIMVEMPCYKEDVDELYKVIADYTESLITEHVAEIKDTASGGKKKVEEEEKPW
jgi:hypothetical protein